MKTWKWQRRRSQELRGGLIRDALPCFTAARNVRRHVRSAHAHLWAGALASWQQNRTAKWRTGPDVGGGPHQVQVLPPSRHDGLQTFKMNSRNQIKHKSEWYNYKQKLEKRRKEDCSLNRALTSVLVVPVPSPVIAEGSVWNIKLIRHRYVDGWTYMMMISLFSMPFRGLWHPKLNTPPSPNILPEYFRD